MSFPDEYNHGQPRKRAPDKYAGLFIEVDGEEFHLGVEEEALAANRALRDAWHGPYDSLPDARVYRRVQGDSQDIDCTVPEYTGQVAKCDYSGCDQDSEGYNWGDSYPSIK